MMSAARLHRFVPEIEAWYVRPMVSWVTVAG